MPLFGYHVIAFVAGFVLDAIFGDPHFLPHPVRFIGKLISILEKHYLGEKTGEEAPKTEEEEAEQADEPVLAEEPEQADNAGQEQMPDWLEGTVQSKEKAPDLVKRTQGRQTVLIVLFVTLLVTDIFLVGGYLIHPILGCVIEAIMTYYALAAKCLVVESMKVYKALKNGTIEDARKAVSMIVGRDTAELDEEGVTRAAVETVAENASDGVIAPMLYLAIGGPILGFAYKAINTMDSMIGYKNERYVDFGRAAAKLDDIVNFVPSRICAWLMILVCPLIGDEFIASEAKRIYYRDRFNHASPNSAQTESVCAGALGIKLGGDASYFGKLVHKPEIGDGRRHIEPLDISRANHLMYGAAILCLLSCTGILTLVTLLMEKWA